jgi:hypothetical protein
MTANATWIKRLGEESGQVLVIAALSMTALMGFVALASDVGVLFEARRNMQTAADAAAVAGALDYLYHGTSSAATSAGKAAASSNGVTDGTGGAVVTISVPPADGPNTGNAAYVEAVVKKPNRTFFMGMFGVKSLTVGARAVAGTPTTGQACIWLMANSGTALDLQGAYSITATGCGIYVNSPSTDALSVTGNGGTMHTKFLDVVGNSPPSHQTNPTPATINAAPRKSPWGNLTGPTPTNGGCTTTDSSTTSITGSVTGPGLNNSICYTKANGTTGVTLNGATLGPGIYVFEKGVTISGTVNINGGTLDIYHGQFTQNSNSLLNITAPTSGTYNGIAILQPATNTNQLSVQFGSSNQKLDGYIYAPGAEVFLHDNGGGVTTTGVVAASMYLHSSSITIPSYDVAHPTTTVNRVVTLVE